MPLQPGLVVAVREITVVILLPLRYIVGQSMYTSGRDYPGCYSGVVVCMHRFNEIITHRHCFIDPSFNSVPPGVSSGLSLSSFTSCISTRHVPIFAASYVLGGADLTLSTAYWPAPAGLIFSLLNQKENSVGLPPMADEAPKAADGESAL